MSFNILKKKNIEALKLCSEKNRAYPFQCLDYKSLEAFKLVDKESRPIVFRYLNEKCFEAFELIDSSYSCRENVFEYLDGYTLKDYLTRSKNWQYREIPKSPFTLEEFKKVELKDRFWKFLFLDNKSIEAFKLIPADDKFKAFKYLDKKSVEAFQLLPFEKERSPSFYFGNLSSYHSSYDDIIYNYDKEPGRYKVFKYLDNKNIQMINLVCDHSLYDPNDPYKLYNYLINAHHLILRHS